MMRISEVVTDTPLVNPRKNPDKDFLYVDISGIDNEKGEIKEYKRLKGSEAPSRARKNIQENDVLVSTVRPNLNATAIVPKSLNNQVCSTGFCVLRSNGRVIPDYLYYFTRTPEFVQALARKTKGASYPAISVDDVKLVEIPIFSIEEQKRIAAFLKSAQVLRDKREQANQMGSRVLQAVFSRMFENDSPKTKLWQWQTIEECMEAIIDYRGKTPPKTTEGIPLITAKIVDDDKLKEPQEFISPDFYQQWMVRGFPKYGDILFTTEAPLGKVAQLRFREKVALAQRIILLRGKQNIVDNRFLLYALRSQKVSQDIKSRATGSTVKGIRQSEFRKVKIPVPPIDLQIRFARIAEHIEFLHAKQAQSKLEITRLFNSLMSRAFKGELVA
jgi:type I restriction enzyme S subunit